MRTLAACIVLGLVSWTPALGRADLMVPLLGDPAGLRGAQFGRDPKTGRLYERLDDTTKQRVTVVLPGGRMLTAASGRTTIQ